MNSRLPVCAERPAHRAGCAASGCTSTTTDADQVEHQRQRGHQPEHRAQAGIAARHGAHLDRGGRSASVSCSGALRAAPARTRRRADQRGARVRHRRAASAANGARAARRRAAAGRRAATTPSTVSPDELAHLRIAAPASTSWPCAVGAPGGVDERRRPTACAAAQTAPTQPSSAASTSRRAGQPSHRPAPLCAIGAGRTQRWWCRVGASKPRIGADRRR